MKTYIISLLLISISLISLGQSTESQLWSSADLSVELSQKIKIDVGIGDKLNLTPFANNKSYTQTEIEYEIIKNLEIGTGYRFTMENKSEGYEKYGRWFVAGAISFKARRLKPYYRVKYQKEQPIFLIGITKPESIQKIRNRLRLKYNIKNCLITPVFSVETFHQYETEGFRLEQYRLLAGFGLKLSKSQEISFYYGIENNFEKPQLQKTHILGIEYSFDI